MSSDNSGYNKSDKPFRTSFGSHNFERLSPSLEKIISALNHFSHESENTFLEIGGKLQSYIKNLRSVNENSSEISNLVSQEIIQKGIRELDNLLNEISAFLNRELAKIIEDKSELRNAGVKITGITEQIAGFNRIVKHLRMLGISTKIESSRLSLEDAGFFALAENVDRLSNLISDKITAIKTKAEFLNNALASSITDLTKLETDQRQQTELIVSKTLHSLNAFREKNGILSENVSAISDLSRNAVKSINEIVSSVQFHDISRQQIEHSVHAVDSVMQAMNAKNAEEQDKEEALGMVYDVCGLQSIQLANTLSEFENAVTVIIDSLENLSGSISSVLNHTFGFGGDDNSINLHDIENELLLIAGVIKNNTEIGRKLSESIKSIVGILDELSVYINEIEEVGSEIEIIAINARVKAARFGSNGSALGVLSESIQKLSIEAKAQTGTTSAILSEIMKESQKLRSDLDVRDSDGAGNYCEQTTQKIDSLIGSMKSIESASVMKVASLQGQVNNLNSDIRNIASKITIQHEARDKIGGAIEMLKETSELLRAKYDFKTDRFENTRNIYSKYTMQSERDIHLNFTGSMDLFPGQENIKKNLNAGENEFGDNIELF